MNDFKLSDHFGFFELTDSDEHPELVQENRDLCTIQHRDNLRLLCKSLLEDIRDEYRRPVTMLSGFRCPALNEAANGSKKSDHKDGRAGDFFIKGVSTRDVYLWIRDRSGLKWHELIYYPKKNFIHISSPKGQDDQQHWVEKA
jgi:zinc D-Ala-D-Ala carboxypeptidase